MKPHLAFITALLPAVLCAQSPVVDRDGDGHSDLWQIFHGIPSANGSDDSDGDGISDDDEEKAGTNPWSGESRFRIDPFLYTPTSATSGQVTFGWEAYAGKAYQFQRSGDLGAGPWTHLGAPVLPPSTGATARTFSLSDNPARRFFRAGVSDTDIDGDGLSGFEEHLIGTSDLTANSGGTSKPPDVIAAADWAHSNDLGLSTGKPLPNLREVDVAYIREYSGTGRPDGADLVTATGTGAWHQLTSWRVGAGPNPVQLATTPPVEGHHPQVHLLSPPANAAVPKFITGRIAVDGNLWLSCRSITSLTGSFIHHKTLGYGKNAGLKVLEFDLAHRTFSTRTEGITRYQVLTAVVAEPTGGGSRSLRVIVWNVNPATGAISAANDSGPLTAPALASVPRVRITRISGNQFELIYSNSVGQQCHLPLWTSDNGSISSQFGIPTVRDIRGNSGVSHDREDSAITGLTTSGYATAIREPGGRLRLAVWDRRPDFYTPDTYATHLLADDSLDLNPAPGIGLATPVLTDSFDGNAQAGEWLAQAMATGDFNGDGSPDAALSAPRRDFDGLTNPGGIFILHGSVNGMENREYVEFWHQNDDGVLGVSADNDNYGSALASGDFNDDGNDDLAIGIPDKDISGKAGAGTVQILYGTPFGLSATGDQLITRDSLGQLSVAGDDFGRALCTGDFNGDGHADLAIGAPGQDVSGESDAGAVHVLWGSASGLSQTGSEMFHQDSAGLAGVAEVGDGFGRSLTAGDFNGDANADLAIGVPLEDVGAVSNAGAVQVLYGNGASGFSASNLITRNGFEGGSDIQGTPATGDNFGWSLAAGDFDDDGAQDLAIGVPGDSALGTDSGAIHVLYGSIFGLTWFDNQFIRQSGSLPYASSLPGSGEAFEDLGWSLATGDCNGDGFTDLIASAPGEEVGGKNDAGMFFVIHGSASGLEPAYAETFHQDSVRTEDGNEQSADSASAANDKFAFSLSCADFNSDGEADVIAGVPRKDKDENELDTGGAHFFRGTTRIEFGKPIGLTLAGDFMWTPKTREVVRGIVTDLTRENAGGAGAGKLYSANEFLPIVHMASSTKTMTLLLAVEAIENGDAALDDDVPFSELAGTTGGSTLDAYDPNGNPLLDEDGDNYSLFVPGDTMPLRLLLAAMMGESCNRASVAIGQHIADRVKGDPDDFVIMMNERAAELGMTQSTFGHPAGGWVTKIQDTVTLQREGVKHPLFVKFASFERYGDDQPEEVLCGTDINTAVKCSGPFDQFTSMDTYPGRYSWKGGNGKLWWGSGQANSVPAEPSASVCTESGVTTARRMDRILASCVQQSGNGDIEVQNLLDYGYRELFTPDHRDMERFPEAGGVVGPDGPIRVKNFAIASWDRHGCTAVIDDFEELRLNVWALNYAANSVVPAGFAKKSFTLQSGATFEEPALVDLTKVPTTAAIADFFTANRSGDALELEIWRSGEDP